MYQHQPELMRVLSFIFHRKATGAKLPDVPTQAEDEKGMWLIPPGRWHQCLSLQPTTLAIKPYMNKDKFMNHLDTLKLPRIVSSTTP